jgi:hypothetical protein
MIFYLYILSLSLSQISSQSLDGQHLQQWCQQEQQQCQPTSTSNTGASVDHESPDATNHATDYEKHAIGAGSAASATTLAA